MRAQHSPQRAAARLLYLQPPASAAARTSPHTLSRAAGTSGATGALHYLSHVASPTPGGRPMPPPAVTLFHPRSFTQRDLSMHYSRRLHPTLIAHMENSGRRLQQAAKSSNCRRAQSVAKHSTKTRHKTYSSWPNRAKPPYGHDQGTGADKNPRRATAAHQVDTSRQHHARQRTAAHMQQQPEWKHTISVSKHARLTHYHMTDRYISRGQERIIINPTEKEKNIPLILQKRAATCTNPTHKANIQPPQASSCQTATAFVLQS